jgi:hypothetical protein
VLGGGHLRALSGAYKRRQPAAFFRFAGRGEKPALKARADALSRAAADYSTNGMTASANRPVRACRCFAACGTKWASTPKGAKPMTRTTIFSSITAICMLGATAAPALAKTQDAQAEAGTSAAKGERKICKILETSGTKMVETKCLTEAGWKEYIARY